MKDIELQHRSNSIRWEDSRASFGKVLLIGVFGTEITLRAGVTEETWGKFGEHYDRLYTGFRFWCDSAKAVIDVPRNKLRDFLHVNYCINAYFHSSRPFSVCMTDGGDFKELPVLDNSGTVVANDRFILDSSPDSLFLVVNAYGDHAYLKPRKVIKARMSNKLRFYNL